MWVFFSLYNHILEVLFPKQCFCCGKEDEILCTSCLSKRRKCLDSPTSFCISVFSYQDVAIRRIITSIKYYNKRSLVLPITRYASRELPRSTLTGVLVPVPMHPLKQLLRGHNQAELIARELGRQLDIPVDTTLLKRSRLTKRQVSSLSKNLRLKNQKQSFSATNVEGLDIILVDDVTTTGATLTEARKALIRSGARQVSAITLAH